MTIWEYTQVTYLSNCQTVLTELGKHGWEAYGVIKEDDFYTIFLKRRKQSEDKK